MNTNNIVVMGTWQYVNMLPDSIKITTQQWISTQNSIEWIADHNSNLAMCYLLVLGQEQEEVGQHTPVQELQIGMGERRWNSQWGYLTK
jgi:hypothetical protein